MLINFYFFFGSCVIDKECYLVYKFFGKRRFVFVGEGNGELEKGRSCFLRKRGREVKNKIGRLKENSDLFLKILVGW